MQKFLIQVGLALLLANSVSADVIMDQAPVGAYLPWLHSLEIAQGCHAEAILARLSANGFNTSRRLVTKSPTDWHTSVQDTLSPGAIDRLLDPRTRRVLDSGCGSCGSAVDLFDPSLRLDYLEYFGLAFSMDGVDQTHIDTLSRVFPDQFKLLTGHFAEDHPSLQGLSVDGILDSNGPFAYTRRPNDLLEVYGSLLAPGSVLDTMYDSHMLVRQGDGREVILPNFQVLDEDNLDVTELWLQSIEGFRRLNETGMTRRSFIPGRPYLNVFERIANARKEGLLPEGIRVEQRQGLTFVRNGREFINVAQTVALMRTEGPVRSPALEEIFFVDGRPPVRIFRWNRKGQG